MERAWLAVQLQQSRVLGWTPTRVKGVPTIPRERTADLELFLVAVAWVRVAAVYAVNDVPLPGLASAVAHFDSSVPDATLFRDMVMHFDEMDRGRLSHMKKRGTNEIVQGFGWIFDSRTGVVTDAKVTWRSARAELHVVEATEACQRLHDTVLAAI